MWSAVARHRSAFRPQAYPAVRGHGLSAVDKATSLRLRSGQASRRTSKLERRRNGKRRQYDRG